MYNIIIQLSIPVIIALLTDSLVKRLAYTTANLKAPCHTEQKKPAILLLSSLWSCQRNKEYTYVSLNTSAL